MPAPQLLDRRALNRATLARQLLLERAAIPAEDAVRHLVGLQAQTAQSWYLTLWSRLSAFDAVAVGELLDDRRLVRLALMRSTIHLVTDDDAPLLRCFSQPAIDRSLRGRLGRHLDGIDSHELAALVRDATRDTPRTPAELWQAAAERWPGRDRMTLSNAMRAVVPLVQVPPRGIWRRQGAVRLAPLHAWIGRDLPASVDVDSIVLRYLAAYGPASAADMQAWSGVTRLGEAFERLRRELIPFRDEAGRELFDLPDAPRPDGGSDAPVRFLADFDNLLLSHANRTRFGSDADRAAVAYQGTGRLPGTLLVDGFVAGRWHIDRLADSATLVVLLLRSPAADDAAAIQREGESMLAFLESDAEARRVDFVLLPAG
jgi:hypothetical protein